LPQLGQVILSRLALLPFAITNSAQCITRIGFTKEEMTAHGFRSSASAIFNERGYKPIG
jgi:hypothetical protein